MNGCMTRAEITCSWTFVWIFLHHFMRETDSRLTSARIGSWTYHQMVHIQLPVTSWCLSLRIAHFAGRCAPYRLAMIAYARLVLRCGLNWKVNGSFFSARSWCNGLSTHWWSFLVSRESMKLFIYACLSLEDEKEKSTSGLYWLKVKSKIRLNAVMDRKSSENV